MDTADKTLLLLMGKQEEVEIISQLEREVKWINRNFSYLSVEKNMKTLSSNDAISRFAKVKHLIEVFRDSRRKLGELFIFSKCEKQLQALYYILYPYQPVQLKIKNPSKNEKKEARIAWMKARRNGSNKRR